MPNLQKVLLCTPVKIFHHVLDLKIQSVNKDFIFPLVTEIQFVNKDFIFPLVTAKRRKVYFFILQK